MLMRIRVGKMRVTEGADDVRALAQPDSWSLLCTRGMIISGEQEAVSRALVHHD